MPSDRYLPAAIMLALLALPAEAQIIKPVLTPPPCTGQGCVIKQRGATIIKPHAKTSAQEAACPPGTVYDGYKGTCHVKPPNAP